MVSTKSDKRSNNNFYEISAKDSNDCSTFIDLLRSLPIPCKASSQAFSVNSFRLRKLHNRGEWPGDAKPFLDHVTRNASAARNNET